MTNIATTVAHLQGVPPAPINHSVGFTTSGSFELAQRVARALASSSLVPVDYRGNLPNCLIALNIAHRMGADPLLVMQNLFIVHGRPAWSAQFLTAIVNSSGKFTSLRYEFFGTKGEDNYGCRAWAIEKSTKEKLVGTDVNVAIAKAEGWYDKKGSKWQTMPQQMLMYRAGSWWARAYAPDLSMGLHTEDEVRDGVIELHENNGAHQTTTAELTGTLGLEVAGKSAPVTFDPPPTDAPREPAVVAIPITVPTTKDGKPDWKSWGNTLAVAIRKAAAQGKVEDCLALNASELNNCGVAAPEIYNKIAALVTDLVPVTPPAGELL